jgi:hypothetical protein
LGRSVFYEQRVAEDKKTAASLQAHDGSPEGHGLIASKDGAIEMCLRQRDEQSTGERVGPIVDKLDVVSD